MITVEEIDAEAAAQLSGEGKWAFEQSWKIWCARREEEVLLLVGLVRWSLIGNVELWFVPKTDFRRRANLLAAREMLREAVRRYPGLIIQTLKGRDERFAKWMGFVPVDERTVNGTIWVRYEYGT